MIDWNKIENLGIIPDVELAKKLNVSPQCIFQARKRKGIIAKNPAPKYKIDWDNVPLGKMTDLHISDMLGCSGAYVSKQRNKRGIPPFGMLYRTVENEGAYYGEAIIDAWLHKHNIDHIFQFNVGKYRVDWLIPLKNEIWEFLGMWDHKLYGKEYRNNFSIKEIFLKEQGYAVRRIHLNEIEIFKNQIDLTLLHQAANFKCKGCQKEDVKHHAKGMCGQCVGRANKGYPFTGPLPFTPPLKITDPFICEDCKSDNRYKRVKNKCAACYDKDRKKRKKYEN